MSEFEERMNVATVDICPCGLVMHQADDYDTLGADSPVCCPDCGNEKFTTIKQLQAENTRLKEFARPVIRQECWSIFEQHGGDIQELAQKLGLIVSYTVTEEDTDDDYEPGDTRFKFSETLKENKP